MRQYLLSIILVFLTGFTIKPGIAVNHRSSHHLNRERSSTGLKKSGNWITLDKAIQLAGQNHKKILIDFSADWCVYCKKMDKEVFPQKKVQALLSKYFYTVKIDVESKDQVKYRGKTYTKAQFAQAFGVSGLPTYVFMDSKGDVIAGQPGYIPAPDFEKILSYIGSDAFNKMTFKNYQGSSTR